MQGLWHHLLTPHEPHITRYQRWLQDERGLSFDSYDALWRWSGRESWMPLFAVLREGVILDDALTKRFKQVIREALSARHVPNEVFQVSATPRTLSGKKMELPVKKLLMGAAADSVFKRDAMANADCVDWFVTLARQHKAAQA